jgi:hypothetical protein
MGEKYCWKDYREHLEETGREGTAEWVHTFGPDGSGTCLLEADHEGDHDFVCNSSIVVTFIGG